jgi:ferritin-like metal-binding protein YciE
MKSASKIKKSPSAAAARGPKETVSPKAKSTAARVNNNSITTVPGKNGKKVADTISGTAPNLRKAPGQARATQAKPGTPDLLEAFFCEELKDIYWAEKHLLKALAKMEKNATAPKLKQAFAEHRKVTEGHVSRLEDVFELVGKKAIAKKCEAIAGITKEGDDIIDETEKGTETRDVGLIMAAQKVEHYEIATYGGLAELARTLGKGKVADILQKTLEEEKEADEALTRLAKKNINSEASQEDGEKADGIFDKMMSIFN